MNDSIIRISLDVQQASGMLQAVSCKRGDTARTIEITLTDGGFPFALPDGCYAVLTGIKADDTSFYNHCEIVNGVVVYHFTEQTANVPGIVNCEVKVYGADDKVVTSALFRMIVSEAVYNDNLAESTNEFSALTYLVSAAAGVLEEVDGAAENAQAAADRAGTAAAAAEAAADTVVANTEKYIKRAETAANTAHTAAIQIPPRMEYAERLISDSANLAKRLNNESEQIRKQVEANREAAENAANRAESAANELPGVWESAYNRINSAAYHAVEACNAAGEDAQQDAYAAYQYKLQAEQAAQNASRNVQQAVHDVSLIAAGIGFFYLDIDESGHLIEVATDNVAAGMSLAIDTNGHLMGVL